MIISTRDPIKNSNDLEKVNKQAKELFDRKEYKKAILLLESIELPVEYIANLAKCYYYAKDAKKAIRLIENLEKDLELQIDFALYHNAIGDHKKAHQIYKSLDQSNPKVQFNSGWHELREDNFKEGFKKLQYGSQLSAWGNEHLLLKDLVIDKSDRWDGTHCNHLVYILEGGIGDQIVFLRWADLLKTMCDKLTIVCHQDLIRLLVNSGYSVEQSIIGLQYDKYAPSMALPTIIDLNTPKQGVNFPYIKSFKEPFIDAALGRVSKEKKKIGIKWFGNPEFEHDQFRSLPKEKLFELSKYGQLFSFQFEENIKDIPNLAQVIKNWQDTYSVMKSLDYIVTSCTSIAHLAGAIGVRVFVMVPIMPYFIWSSDNLTWYNDNVTVIRQTEYDNWDKPFEKLYNILENE